MFKPSFLFQNVFNYNKQSTTALSVFNINISISITLCYVHGGTGTCTACRIIQDKRISRVSTVASPQ